MLSSPRGPTRFGSLGVRALSSPVSWLTFAGLAACMFSAETRWMAAVVGCLRAVYLTLGLVLTGDAGGETTLTSLSPIGELVRDAPFCRFALSV